MSRNRKKLVPQCSKALETMKYEIAAELGILNTSTTDFSSEFSGEFGGHSQGMSHNVDWGGLSSRQNGSIGGSITKRLIQQAQQSMLDMN